MRWIRFICTACKSASDGDYPPMHLECKGGTWCDCQHRVKAPK